MKHLAAAVSIRMPLQFSFNLLAAVMTEMGLQRHLCLRSPDAAPGRHTCLAPRQTATGGVAGKGWKGFGSTWSTNLRQEK